VNHFSENEDLFCSYLFQIYISIYKHAQVRLSFMFRGTPTDSSFLSLTDSSFLSPHVEITVTFYLFFQIHSPIDSFFFLYSI
jgi:hypothetical protein